MREGAWLKLVRSVPPARGSDHRRGRPESGRKFLLSAGALNRAIIGGGHGGGGMHWLWVAAVVTLAAALAGCETWVKPGGTPQEFDAMRAQCSAQAYGRFPPLVRPVQTSGGHYTPTTTHCVTKGNVTDCTQTGGHYVPPTFSTTHDNQRPPRTPPPLGGPALGARSENPSRGP